MKKIYLLSFLSASFFSSPAQNQPRGFHLEKPINMAAILAKKPSIASGFSSVSEARSIINDIMDVSDVQQNFRVEATNQVDNAAAVIYQNTRYILYNPSFINQLDNAARDKWASISVIGHEIAHHILGHTLDGRGSQIPKELEADEFSGLVLRRMGASLQQAQLAMKLIASPHPSATHPGENDRLAAIARGWNNTTARTGGGDNDVTINTPSDRRSTYPNSYPQADRGDSRSYPVPSDEGDNYPSRRNRRNYPPPGGSRSDYPNNDSRRNGRRNGTAAQSIVYEIKFNGNNFQQYYITSQNQVIVLRGNRPQVVAKIAATNNGSYPYVIFDDRQEIYVDRRGNLFTQNSRRSIGYIARVNS